MESICNSCKYYRYYPEKITVDPYWSEPEEWECLEDSENFLTDDGCYRYEENKEIDYEGI